MTDPMKNAKETGQFVTIGVRLPPRLGTRVEEASKRRGISRAALARICLVEFLDAHDE